MASPTRRSSSSGRHRLGHVRLLHRRDQRRGRREPYRLRASEDDNVIVQGVAGEPGALGYLGFSYYEENKDKLKAVEVDGGNGCVAPSAAAAQDGTYTPLARPLFVYVKRARSSEEVEDFVDYILDNEQQIAEKADFVSLNEDSSRSPQRLRVGRSRRPGRPLRRRPAVAVVLRRSNRRLGEMLIKVLLARARWSRSSPRSGSCLAAPSGDRVLHGDQPDRLLHRQDWAPLFEPAASASPLLVGTLSSPSGRSSSRSLRPRLGDLPERVREPAVARSSSRARAPCWHPDCRLRLLRTDSRHAAPAQLGVQVEIFNVLAAGLVMGVMLIPTVASLSEDAMSSVPRALRDGAYGLGADKLQVSTRVIVPAAISGIIASFILAISRAVGETMIVLIAMGQQAKLTFDPRQAMETMTAFIGATGNGDLPTGSTEYKTIFAVGFTLFVITLVMNMISIRLVRKYREVYD